MKALPVLLSLLAIAPTARQSETAAPQFLEGPELARFLGEVEERMEKRVSIAAAFEQEKILSLFEDTLRTQGLLLFARPDRLRWEIQEPFQSVLITAGDDVAKFEFVAGERRALKLGRAKDPLLMVMVQIRGWFLGRFDWQGGAYQVRAARSPAPMVVLAPTKKVLAKSLTGIEIQLAETLDSVSSVIVRYANGDLTTMRFTELARDAALPADYFSVTDPAPLDLDDLRAKVEEEPR